MSVRTRLLSVRFPRDRKAVPHGSFQGAVNKPLRVEYRGPIGHAVHPIKPFTHVVTTLFLHISKKVATADVSLAAMTGITDDTDKLS